MKRIQITQEKAQDAILGDEYIGYCLACGAEHYGVEPDAREYRCDVCGEFQVYGLEELFVMGMVDIIPE